jgi:hypothetical protein
MSEISKLSTEEFHSELVGTYNAFAEDTVRYEAFIIDLRRRFNDGETVGGCTGWFEYIDKHLRRHDESLSTATRRFQRMLEGENPAAAKHDGSKQRMNNTATKKKASSPTVTEVHAEETVIDIPVVEADDASDSAKFTVLSTPVHKERIAFPRYADELSTPLIDKVTHSDYDAETQIKIFRIIAGNIQAVIHEIEIQSAEEETEAVAAVAS